MPASTMHSPAQDPAGPSSQLAEYFDYRDGELWCENVPLRTIAETVGTPAYIYSMATLRRSVQGIQAMLRECGTAGPLIAYSVRANANATILATLAGLGIGADIASIGEYRQARRAGIPADSIVFSGVGKTGAEMAEALENGLFQFNVESIEEARILAAVAAAAGRIACIAFRVGLDGVAGPFGSATGLAGTKFGVPASAALGAYDEAARLPGIAIRGLVISLGSQPIDRHGLERALRRVGQLLRELRLAGHRIDLVQLGSGIECARGGPLGPPLLLAELGEIIRRVADCWQVRLVFAPGGSIVADSAVLLSRVIRVKGGAPHPWVIVDAAAGDLAGQPGQGADHDIQAVVPNGSVMTANVAGPLCDVADTFAREREIDAIEQSQLVVFRTAGAYSAATASGYHSRPLPAEVVVDGDRWALVRKPLQIDELSGHARPRWRNRTAVHKACS